MRTLHSGVSRGTETLVFGGRVPESQYATMRAPFQEGDFPGPVKYGYLNVGVVERGPAGLVGRTVFCLYPHQTAYVVPASAVTVVPDGVPPARAVLAGTVETAVNALWDARPLVGDRVAVVGAGMVGCCVARLLAGVPGATVTLVDVDGSREPRWPRRSGWASPRPGDAAGDLDLVVHTSGTSAGLQTALELLAPDGEVLELSWYGDAPVTVELGGVFHSRRLAVRASQVGEVAAARRGRRTHADRLALALDLLRDPAFDVLLTGESPFEELPQVMANLASGSPVRACVGASSIPTIPTPWGGLSVHGDGARPHDDRPQLPRGGLRSGAAAARGDVRRRRGVHGPAPGLRRRAGRHRPRGRPAQGRAVAAQLPQPRRRGRLRGRQHLHRGARARRRRPAGRAGAPRGDGGVRAGSGQDRGHAARVARGLGELREGAAREEPGSR